MFSSNKRTTDVSNAMVNTKLLIERDFTEFIQNNGKCGFEEYINSRRSALEIQFSGIANCTDTVIFIVDNKGNVIVSNSGSELNGRMLNYEFLINVRNSDDPFNYEHTGDLDGLLESDHVVKIYRSCD